MTDLILAYPTLVSMLIVVGFWRLAIALIDRRDSRALALAQARPRHRRFAGATRR